MIMEEMWNMRAFSFKPSAQSGPSTIKQFSVGPVQFSQPCMAKEVCVIEQTSRQDSTLPNSVNLNSQALHPDKVRPELQTMMLAPHQDGVWPSYGCRAPYAASLSQFSVMSLPDVGNSWWPSQSLSILSQPPLGAGGVKVSAGPDALLGQGKDFMTGGKSQDNPQTVNGSGAPVSEFLMQSDLSFGRCAREPGMQGSWQVPSSRWSMEPARQSQHRNQHFSNLLLTNSGDPCGSGVSTPLHTTVSGYFSQSQSAPVWTSSGRLRVHCISYLGRAIVGQLGLSEAGRLGITCSCHGIHMSVAKFSQHAGLNFANPGEVVYMEGGETLVQWRKLFFSQYGVMVPEDSAGWEWLDGRPPMELPHGNGKFKAAVSGTRTWNKEGDMLCGGSTPVRISRSTRQQMSDVLLSNGNASMPHATKSMSNVKYGLSSTTRNNCNTLDSRVVVLKSCGPSYKSMALANQLYMASSAAENLYPRTHVNIVSSSTFQSMGQVPTSNGHGGLVNNGGGRCRPLTGHQQQGSFGSRTEANHSSELRLGEGQELRMREADFSSSFELCLGQPSQQMPAAGMAFSMATSSVERPKSHLFEQVMSRVWDGKLQYSLEQFKPANLSKFSGNPCQVTDQEVAPKSALGWPEENLENIGLERRGEEPESAANSTAISQSPRQPSHFVLEDGIKADGVSERIQVKLMSLKSLQNQSDMSSRCEDGQSAREPAGSERLAAKLFPYIGAIPSRSVALENGTTLDSLSSVVLEHLSRETGQRLLDSAISSSFTYRAMGLKGPAAGALQLNGFMASTSRKESRLFGPMNAYGRSNFVGGQRASFLELLVRDQLEQNESEVRCGLGVASTNVSAFQVDQDPNLLAFRIRDQPKLSFMEQQHVVQRLVELGSGSVVQKTQTLQSLMPNRNATEWQTEEQLGKVMDRQESEWSQGGHEEECMANFGLKSSNEETDAVVSSRLSQSHGEGGGKDDLDATALATDAASARECLEVSALSGVDIHFSCLKCREASHSGRGQAVPRFVGQICSKEKSSLASSVKTARKGTGESNDPSQVEQPNMDIRACTVDSGREGVEEADDERENEEDVCSDTAAKRTAAVGGRGSPRTAGKLERKQRRYMRWKGLGSDGADGADVNYGSLGGSSFGQEAGPQTTSEAARTGSKDVEETAGKPDERDFVRAWSGEMVPSKRRKLLIPRRHQEVKSTNVTEKNIAAATRSLGDDSSKKAGTTLVIRVSQGVEKAKKGIRTKLLQNPKLAGRDWKADEVCRADWGGGRRGLEAGKLAVVRVSGPSMKGCEFASGRAAGALMNSVRSPRTPLAGPSPRNGRMVSLSVILNQPAAAKMVNDSQAFVQQIPRDDIANTISLREGKTMHKRSEAHSESVSGVAGSQLYQVRDDRGHPSLDITEAWKISDCITTRLVQRKELPHNQKIRSMLELPGKIDDDMHGPCASSASEFGNAEYHGAAPRDARKHIATTSAAVQTVNPSAGLRTGPGRWKFKSYPFPRGERSVRPGCPKKRKFDWNRSADYAGKSWSVGAENVASEKEEIFVCKISQVRSAAGSSISKETLQEGFGTQSFPFRKQVRSSKAKRVNEAIREGLQAKGRRAVSGEGLGLAENQKPRRSQGLVMLCTTGNGVLKRRAELLLPGGSVKKPKLVFGMRRVKEGVGGEIEESMESGDLSKSSRQNGFWLEQSKTEASMEHVGGSVKIQKRDKCQMSIVNGRSSTCRKDRIGAVQGNQSSQAEKYRCDVCGTFSSASYNKLLCCGRCPVKVHQACYGVPKVPKGPWMCRICKLKVTNPICVLCGYGGGAMTRVQKARPLCQGLLQTWRELRNENTRPSASEEEDDNETLLSATNSIHISRARSAEVLMGMTVNERVTKLRDSDLCVHAESRDESSVCKVCGKDSPEPGSIGGNGAERGPVVPKSGREDWKTSNTVGSIVKDAGAKQWAHMVCTLWMPGTRCLNMGTMGVFDVSGVTTSRRKALCSICQRKGGACIQCRVPKCATPFHVWCAHEKGLLQSEIVQDGSNKVGFFGKCSSHAITSGMDLEDVTREDICPSNGGCCARTEGYKGRLTLEERATAQHYLILEGATAVTREQVAVWLRISERKMASRRVPKPTNRTMKFDHREYLRFKQKKGWRNLAVCKSGIHALGLYTTVFIAEGEVVVEYVGEIVGLRVADKREAEYHSGKRLQYQGACYLFRIDSEQIVDATRKGGIARFVNHSCSPNCVAKVICADNLKKVIFFAKRDIYAGEEVTYDYKFNYDEIGDKIPCFCGTIECRGTLN